VVNPQVRLYIDRMILPRETWIGERAPGTIAGPLAVKPMPGSRIFGPRAGGRACERDGSRSPGAKKVGAGVSGERCPRLCGMKRRASEFLVIGKIEQM
jgi:hypothetical protein